MRAPRTIDDLLSAAMAMADETNDFIVAGPAGPAFVALSRSRNASLLVPLREAPPAAGRFAAGISLVPHASIEFRFDGHTWIQPAAVLECLDRDMLKAFGALIGDLTKRLPQRQSDLHWSTVLAIVDEWQALLASRGLISSEREIGLWGELWVIAESSRPDSLVAAWRGPEAAPFDFLYASTGIEVKTSRRRHEHDVSLSQVERPAGDLEAYLLSLWVAVDPHHGLSLPELFARVLGRVAERTELLRRVSTLGYVPIDAAAYPTRYALLERPWWVSVDQVPTIRALDPGVSRVRYTITLDESTRAIDPIDARLWTRIGHPFS